RPNGAAPGRGGERAVAGGGAPGGLDFNRRYGEIPVWRTAAAGSGGDRAARIRGRVRVRRAGAAAVSRGDADRAGHGAAGARDRGEVQSDVPAVRPLSRSER